MEASPWERLSSPAGTASRTPPRGTPLSVSSLFLLFRRSVEAAEECRHLAPVVRPPRGGKCNAEDPAVPPGRNPAVEQRHHPVIVPPAEKPPDALPQRKDRLGELVLHERVRPPVAHRPDAGRGHGVGRGGERQLVDDDAPQGGAWNV